MSHKFRTPLTLMLGPLEDLLARPAQHLPLEQRDLIFLAHRNGTRLLKLVNALLDFSRIEAGRIQANFEPVDLAAFTSDLLSNFRSAIDKAGLRLVVDCPALPAPVHVDRDMWEKVVLNLLSNAFKFTFDGEIAVTMRPTADGRGAQLEVRDTGTGIPAAELPHLFERFRRVEGARGRTIEGSGIGLALVQELVKLHGGTIGVESRVDQGTMPFGSSHLPEDKIETGRASVPTAVGAQAYVNEALGWLAQEEHLEAPPASGADDFGLPGTAADAEGHRVLLADDNADMRQYLQRLLVNVGYRVATVNDGQAALEEARAHKPDLIISDS